MSIHPLEPLILKYLSDKDITAGTKETYQTVFKQYIRYLKINHIIYAKTSDIINFVEWKRKEGCSSCWSYHLVNTIKGLYKYLRLNQIRLALPEDYATDIAESLKNVKIDRDKSKPILTIEQAKHLILCTKQKRKYIWQFRDYAMIYLMITTGMRSVEIRRAKIKDIRVLGNQFILFVQGKGRKTADEFVKLTSGVYEAIQEYLKKRKDKNPFLFISHRKHSDILHLSRPFFVVMFKRVLKECDLEYTKITSHSLRHTAATLNLLRGGTLEETSRFMRHETMASTLIYSHHLTRLNDDSEDMIEQFILKEDSKAFGDVFIILDL